MFKNKTVNNRNEYDTLECPYCDEPSEPVSVKEGMYVTYKCEGACCNTFHIDWDGDLIE